MKYNFKKIDIDLFKDSTWKEFNSGTNYVWLKGYIHNFSFENVGRSVFNLNWKSIKDWLNNLDGHFSIIVKT